MTIAFVRALTILPSLLFVLLSVALGLFAVVFAVAYFAYKSQYCADCPIDRSGQFAMIMAVYFGLTAALAAVHAVVALGVWRHWRWASPAGIVLAVLAIAAIFLFMAPTYAVVAVVYAAAAGLLLAGLMRARNGNAPLEI